MEVGMDLEGLGGDYENNMLYEILKEFYYVLFNTLVLNPTLRL